MNTVIHNSRKASRKVEQQKLPLKPEIKSELTDTEKVEGERCIRSGLAGLNRMIALSSMWGGDGSGSEPNSSIKIPPSILGPPPPPSPPPRPPQQAPPLWDIHTIIGGPSSTGVSNRACKGCSR